MSGLANLRRMFCGPWEFIWKFNYRPGANFKSDPAEMYFEPDPDMQVTTFRALQPSEKRSSISSKFNHCDTSLDTDSDWNLK